MLYSWLEKAYKNYNEIDPKKSTMSYLKAEMDLKNLINLLSPSRNRQQANLFSLIMENYTTCRYMLNESNLPLYTQYLISSKNLNSYILGEYDVLFNAMGGVKGHSKEKFELILNPYEFYLFVFIFSMKKFKTITSEPKRPEVIYLCTSVKALIRIFRILEKMTLLLV